MIKRVTDSLHYGHPAWFSPILTTIMLFLAFSLTHAAVPKDQIPVPYSQLSFEGNYRDISRWPATKILHSVGIEGSQLYMPNDGACSWPSPDGNVNANVHIILYHDGKWISSPWDYMGVCQEHKHFDAIGDIPYPGWKPRAGETYYFFLTTISRDPSGVGEERTNVVKYVWFGPTGYPPPVEPECVGPPVINSFKATPNPVFSGTMGLLGPDHNVQLSWNISNGDGVKLVAGSGESAETSEHGPVLGGLELLLKKTETFTIYAKNKCTPEAQWPSKTITVQLQAPLPFLSGLILYNGADVETWGSSGTTANSSFLYGAVNPHHQEAKALFEFGTTPAYGRKAEALPKSITGDDKTTIAVKVTGLQRGTVYHYRARAKLREKLTYGVDRTFKTDDIPTVTTDSASPVHDTYATLRGTTNPNGATTSVTFYYGETTGYGSSIAGSALADPDGSTPQSTNANVTNLQKNSPYHYKVCATNSVGTRCGGDKTFTTYAPPEVVTDAATTITDISAILNGRVDPNRKDTTVSFEWGTSDSYGNTVAGSPAALSGDGPQASSANISGLTKGTTYHYRIVGQNPYGTDYGDDMTFTTDDEPGVITELPTILSSTEATLRATISPHGAETRVYFQWSDGSCPPEMWYNEQAAIQSPIAENVQSEVASYYKDGSIGSVYCYRAVAENGVGGEVGTHRVYGEPVEINMTLTAE
ncbi:MAG: hypothetical protein K9K37_12795 [Desulfocapsa sp.]|nr:hypothetical protein [Desulfocapsa sp.]